MAFDKKTGEVTIRDFDQGVIETLGATVHPDNQYYVNLPQMHEVQDVPVVFNQPEQILVNHRLPVFAINRLDLEPDNARWHSVEQFEYREGIGNPEIVDGVTGYASYETKSQAWPFNIPYVISCYGRYEHEAQIMLRKMMRRFRPYCAIFVRDSLNEIRSYTGFVEGAIANISETIDVADRVKAYSITVRVEAEIDLHDPFNLTDTLSGTISNVGILD